MSTPPLLERGPRGHPVPSAEHCEEGCQYCPIANLCTGQPDLCRRCGLAVAEEGWQSKVCTCPQPLVDP